MKNKTLIIVTVGTAVISSLVTALAFRYFESPREFVLRDGITNARYASFSDFMLSGRLQRTFVSSAPTNFTAAAAAITPSVVNIKALTGEENNSTGEFGASSGSGVIITQDGYIVTNRHVIEGATDIQVTLNDKRDFDAKVVGVDPSTDLALLKVEAKDITPVRFGNSDSIRVGEWVLAVGNPFNLESTVTAGIISAKGRSINVLDDTYSIESFIQTDAAVNPGNSGGALVNTNGELVGITTAIITKSGRYEGYSFAIPANLVMKIVRDLREFGKVQRGFLGVYVEEMTPELARTLKLPSAQGVYLKGVEQGKAAAEGGLRTGDVIIGVNGIQTNNKSELVEAIARYRPGNTIELEFFRQGKRFKTKVMLKNEANNATVAVTPKGKLAGERLGILEMRILSQLEMRKIGSRGVRVTRIQPNSVISATNMGADFIITHINDVKIESPEQVHTLLGKLSGKIVLEGLYDGETSAYFYTFRK